MLFEIICFALIAVMPIFFISALICVAFNFFDIDIPDKRLIRYKKYMRIKYQYVTPQELGQVFSLVDKCYSFHLKGSSRKDAYKDGTLFAEIDLAEIMQAVSHRSGYNCEINISDVRYLKRDYKYLKKKLNK